ncbi:hypothetical protein L202_08007 [Cryptococcus amylolentus CBS 6039]|uniref:RING-type domain-containing protein n=1 Tax=Cryptococcus amylolentus CBS 6039 TaxID=1295533 RepID=A0A1E3HB19_9TREE|nr:hypothetical protein L202_08007 [Cryptococcus amylolentus CBS 6039]ODN73504.1 hypothetical protein L202_08007 [Cryptococcus amylolentus CBS 6039]
MASLSQNRPPPGLPILSGVPVVVEASHCRKCDKEFNPLWRRKKTCGHCGYQYCSNCISDGQALMPRRPGQQPLNQTPLGEIKMGLGIDDDMEGSPGYYKESVCTFCLGMLQVTTAPLQILRSLPIKRLKNYLTAYNIPSIGLSEKEELVQTVFRARDPTTGCLSAICENHFRRHSVPGKITARPNPASSQPRPPPPPNGGGTYASSYQRPQPQQARPPPPNYAYARPQAQAQGSARAHYQTRPQPSSHTQARPPPPQQARPAPAPTPSRPTPAAPRSPAASTPPPPVPSILSLVALPDSYLASLGIGTLKAILYENHVRVDFKQVLEKGELIARVKELIDDERKRLERQRIAEQQEAALLAQSSLPTQSASTTVPNGTIEHPEVPTGEALEKEKVEAGEAKVVPTGPMPEIERGLCVVCQDEEATLAVVDCGHLCMCQHCSDLIWATTQECPLCRTRIVTKHRLIRIYKV